MDERNNYTKAFAPIIWKIIEVYRVENDSSLRRSLRESIHNILQKWTDRPVEKISRKFSEMAKSLEINPWNKIWKDRAVFGRNSVGKSNAVWEHTTPLSEFINQLIECESLEKLLQELNNYSGICWITREEDDILTNKGYRNQRPQGWEKCYEDCNINVIYREK